MTFKTHYAPSLVFTALALASACGGVEAEESADDSLIVIKLPLFGADLAPVTKGPYGEWGTYAGPISLNVRVENRSTAITATAYSITCDLNAQNGLDPSLPALTISQSFSGSNLVLAPGQARVLAVPYPAGLTKAQVGTALCRVATSNDPVGTNNRIYCNALNGFAPAPPYAPAAQYCSNPY